MTQYVYHLNQQDQPFSTKAIADNEARLLTSETGRSWEVVPYSEGFAPRAKLPEQFGSATSSSLPQAAPPSKGSKISRRTDKGKTGKMELKYSFEDAFRPSWLAELHHLMIIVSVFIPGVVLFLLPEHAHRVLPIDSQYLRGLGAGLLTFASFHFAYVALQKIYYYSYRINEEGIESTEGLLKKEICPVAYHAIQTINVHRPFLLRLLGLGTIEFSTSGGDGPEARFVRVKNPMAIKDFVYARVGERSKGF